MSRLAVWGVEGLPEVSAGDDLAALIAVHEPGLRDGDIIVVTSKVVSKAEGRLVPGARHDHIASQTVRLVAQRGDTRIVETPHGLVLAAAGIDSSNVPDGLVALLPLDPDASAGRIRGGLRERAGVDVAVIVSDTMGRPWREGVTDAAIGAAGVEVLWDLRGQRDPAGHLLEATVVAVADELTAAADLVKGKLAATPVAVVRGFPLRRNNPDRGARPLVRRATDDMFRLGTREAQRQVIADSAPLPAGSSGEGDPAAIHHAVETIRPDHSDVTIEVGEAGTIVVAGEPLVAGVAIGRLLVALSAEGLRAAMPTQLGPGRFELRVGEPPATAGGS